MPTYVYAVINRDGSDGETFEMVQKMSDPPLTKHPETGAAVRRVPQRPIVPGKGSDWHTKKLLSNKNLDALGFTKYEKSGDGVYEKKAGKGPDVIQR
jgi:predicted nucleic acid-binding Zn ribbon protein